jgi:hydrogenase maturation protease
MSLSLIIGYGNSLRGDDGVGPAVVALIGARQPGARAIALPMLVPELAPLVAAAPIVVFVDAGVDAPPGDVRVERLDEGGDLGAFGHLVSPRAIVGLARRLYAGTPAAFQVSVGVACFDVGVPLSPAVAAAVPRAVDAVMELLDGCLSS